MIVNFDDRRIVEWNLALVVVVGLPSQIHKFVIVNVATITKNGSHAGVTTYLAI
jgi:hypothetical protein